MNEIYLNNDSLPVICGTDFCAASESFFHVDRVADFNVLIFVTEGKIYVTEDENDFEIGAGEMLLLKQGVHHFGKYEIPRGTCWYYVHFYLDGEKRFEEFLPQKAPIPPYTSAKCSVMLPKKVSGLGGSEIEKKLSKLAEYFSGEDEMKKWYCNEKLFDVLSECAFVNLKTEREDKLSEKISEYLIKHCCEKFSSKALENEFYLSYKYLAAVFKEDKKMTMQQLHTKSKMDTACRLLKSTLMTVGEISEYVGYSDKLYFSKCFHKSVGQSPTEYRKTSLTY